MDVKMSEFHKFILSLKNFQSKFLVVDFLFFKAYHLTTSWENST